MNPQCKNIDSLVAAEINETENNAEETNKAEENQSSPFILKTSISSMLSLVVHILSLSWVSGEMLSS